MIALQPKYSFKVPVYAECITPDIFLEKSVKEISRLIIREGNKQKSLGDIFEIIEKDEDQDENIIVLNGDFHKVRMIGYKMTSGTIIIKGNSGMRLGEGMKGGNILVNGNVDSWVGCMMKGGKIEVKGSAEDYVGSSYRGTTEGMTGGEILIHGNAGNEIGCNMNGGLIKVESNVGFFPGIHMKDGTIIILGDCMGRAGAEMIDGKIIVCGHLPSVLPTFTIESVRSDVKINGERIEGPFYRFTGDVLKEGRGKLFVAKNRNPHLKVYEKYL